MPRSLNAYVLPPDAWAYLLAGAGATRLWQLPVDAAPDLARGAAYLEGAGCLVHGERQLALDATLAGVARALALCRSGLRLACGAWSACLLREPGAWLACRTPGGFVELTELANAAEGLEELQERLREALRQGSAEGELHAALCAPTEIRWAVSLPPEQAGQWLEQLRQMTLEPFAE